MAGIDDEVNRFQDTQPEDIPAVGDSAASTSKGKRRKGALVAKPSGGWDVNAGSWYARNHAHTPHPGGPMAPPSSSDLDHHQEFSDPNRTRDLSPIEQLNDLTPMNRFESEPEGAWVPLRIAPPLSNSGLLTSFSSSPAMARIGRTIKSDEGYCTNSQLDAQSVHSMSTWNMNQDPRSIQRRRIPLPSAESVNLSPEGSRQRPENDQTNSFIGGHSITGGPTQQSPSEHGSPELSAAGDTCEVASNWSVSCDEQGMELPTELLPLQAELVEQIKADYILNWRACHGHIRSRPSEQSTAGSRQQRFETSRSTKPPAPSASYLGKRRREEDENPDDVPSSDDDDRKRRRAPCETVDPENRLFACPYAKYDPTRYSEMNEAETNYRRCSSKVLKSIARVKQHLYRVHTRPAQYCSRCGTEFDRQDLLEAHMRETTPCDIQELPFKEKMTAEQRDSVHKRTPGKQPRQAWFEIFRILFPDARKPSSPYAETGSPASIQDFLAYCKERGAQIVSARLKQIDPSWERYVLSMLEAVMETTLQDLVREFGNDFRCLPVDNLQHSSDPGLLAEVSTTLPAIPEAINPSLQHLEVGPSLTDYTGSGSNAAGFVPQPPAGQLIEYLDLLSVDPYLVDESAYCQYPGSSTFAALA